jgi:hypothetical protein
MRPRSFLHITACLLVLALAGCKQGLNQRCSVNNDCNSGLVCSAATGTCVSDTGSGVDAPTPDAQPIDAPKLDAKPIDAKPIDAPKLDAPVDGASG